MLQRGRFAFSCEVVFALPAVLAVALVQWWLSHSPATSASHVGEISGNTGRCCLFTLLPRPLGQLWQNLAALWARPQPYLVRCQPNFFHIYKPSRNTQNPEPFFTSRQIMINILSRFGLDQTPIYRCGLKKWTPAVGIMFPIFDVMLDCWTPFCIFLTLLKQITVFQTLCHCVTFRLKHAWQHDCTVAERNWNMSDLLLKRNSEPPLFHKRVTVAVNCSYGHLAAICQWNLTAAMRRFAGSADAGRSHVVNFLYAPYYDLLAMEQLWATHFFSQNAAIWARKAHVCDFFSSSSARDRMRRKKLHKGCESPN